jgi:hypothetical protein
MNPDVIALFGPIRMNLNAVSLLFEENSLFQQNNSLLTFQNSLFR